MSLLLHKIVDVRNIKKELLISCVASNRFHLKLKPVRRLGCAETAVFITKNSLVRPYGHIHVKRVKDFSPTVHCLRIAIERRTWSQNDALVMKNQLKEPIFTLFVFFAIVQIVFCMENINYLLSKSKISLLDCNNNRQPCP